MDMIIFVFVGGMCLYLGVKTYNDEAQNKVFSKYPLPVKDVQKYNHACGALIIGFGVAAELTLILMSVTTGWFSTLCTLCIIAEAVFTMMIYRTIEKKHRK